VQHLSSQGFWKEEKKSESPPTLLFFRVAKPFVHEKKFIQPNEQTGLLAYGLDIFLTISHPCRKAVGF
jgi:hypothetical protein